MAIDHSNNNSAKGYVRIAHGDETAAYIHRDHMSIPCENDDIRSQLLACLKALDSSLVFESVDRDGYKPIVRIRWA